MVMDAVRLWAVKIKRFLVITIMSHLLSLVSKTLVIICDLPRVPRVSDGVCVFYCQSST